MTPLRFGIRLGLAIATLASVATAQQVTVTGVVQPAGPSICLDGSHQLECTVVRLKSSLFDLDALLGQNVRVSGVQTASCPVIDVTGVDPFPPATLVRCGSPTPGCPMRFRVGPPALGQFLLFVAFSTGYAPVSPGVGTWLLGEPFLLFASGLTSDGPVDIVVPDDPAFIGLEVWLQAARRDIGPVGPWALSNAVCFTVTGPSPPCAAIDC